MIKIPNENKRFSQPNNSNLFGNIWYTKNMNFDEEGYAKLASRCFQFKSEEDDSDFNFPISFGRNDLEFHIVTADKAYDLAFADNDLAIVKDTNTNSPTLAFDSWGKWFQNRWHASTATKIWYTTGAGWTDTAVALTTGKVHVMEVFRNKNSLAVSNGNTVLLLDTSYATTVTLTLPADHEVIGMAYSNGKMGIITRLSDSATGQNGDAYFFQWDGSSSEAGAGVPIGSDVGAGIVAYKSSWVILARTGELKYWNGGGFGAFPNGEEVRFPFYFSKATWGDARNRETHGDNMSVEGELIFINIGNNFSNFGMKGEKYLQNNPAGVWCYDPKVGLYHRYSPSLSPGYYIDVLEAGINTTTDILTKNAGTIPPTGSPIKQVDSDSSPVGGLVVGKIYYVIKHTSTTFSLATTRANAEAGNKVDITSAASASFLGIDTRDFGSTIVNRVGGIGVVEYLQYIADHLLFGVEMNDYNSENNYDMLQITSSGFDNRGYMVSAKATSLTKEDNIPVVVVKHRPMKTEDKIIVKIKNTERVGIPTSTPQFTGDNKCTWTNDTTFTTTDDLSDIKSYLEEDSENECEVEIIGGAGAGQMAQISSIEESAGTYTVILAEAIIGASSGRVCDIIIDNWKLLKTDKDESSISSSNTKGWEEFPLAKSSKSALFKIEFRGSETTLEDFFIDNKEQL